METVEQAEVSDALEFLRTQTRRGSFEETIVAEIQVIRATLVRLVLAIQGDKAMGADGLVSVSRSLAARLEVLEKLEAERDTAKKTNLRTFTIVATVATAAGSIISFALQWLAR